jgi:hypothetical protein
LLLLQRAGSQTGFDIGLLGCKLDQSEFEIMTQELHKPEENRDQARSYLQQREGELTSKLTKTKAELNAAMDGLHGARLETEELWNVISHSSKVKT